MSSIGTVKWFDPRKGYGFIATEDGNSDIFVHISEVEKAGYNKLDEGQKVEFEIATNRGRQAAAELKIL